MLKQNGIYEYRIERDDQGVPIFVILKDFEPILVLDYFMIKELLSHIPNYLIKAESYYAD